MQLLLGRCDVESKVWVEDEELKTLIENLSL